MAEKLQRDLAQILNREPSSDEARFRYVVLLDDFSASGLSYIRKDAESNAWAGRYRRSSTN